MNRKWLALCPLVAVAALCFIGPAHGQRRPPGGNHPPVTPAGRSMPRQQTGRPPVIRPLPRPAGNQLLRPPTEAPMSLPVSPELLPVVVPMPIVVPRPPPPKSWREFSGRVSASPLGSMFTALGGGLAKGWEFLKDHAPDMTGALSHLGDMVASGAAMLPSIADLTGSVSQAAKSVADFAASALPSLTNVTESVSGAADSISRTAGSISGIIAAIGGFIEKAKWFLIILLGMVVALLLARVIRLGLTFAQIIARVLGFLGFLTRRAQAVRTWSRNSSASVVLVAGKTRRFPPDGRESGCGASGARSVSVHQATASG